MSRVRFVAVIAACTAIMGVGASAAAAKTTTYHFFSKDVYSRISDANGNPVSPNAMPVAGDRFSFASDDYVGNHRHHARRATASDHVVCTIMPNGKGLCDGQISIGGSMILGDDFVLDFSAQGPSVTVLKITGGTGRYRHARGTIVAKSVSQNTTDLTIRVTT